MDAQSIHKWSTIVPATYNTTNYLREHSNIWEHQFTVKYDDKRPIKLLRLDIQDRFYLKEFSLIYLETGETVKGIDIGDKFYFRFIWPAKKGNYKIVAKGGQYNYSVFILESTLTLPTEPTCIARSPFNLLIGWPIGEDPLYKQVSTRKIGVAEWENAAITTDSNVPVTVDLTSAYEVKVKLVVPDLFETEDSKTLIVNEHQLWANQRQPNVDFFDTTLRFQIYTRYWLSNFSMTLRFKPHNEEDWNSVEKAPFITDLIFQTEEQGAITWDLENILYEQLIDNDMLLDWQLVFRNTNNDQIVESDIRTVLLHKRHRMIKEEPILTKVRKFVQPKNSTATIYLCPDGQFWFRQDRTRHASNMKVIGMDRTSIKGNYTMKRKSDSSFSITLNPKFNSKTFEHCELDNLSKMLLPELVKIIINFVVSPPLRTYSNKLKSVVDLNRVCKQWFNIFAEIGVQITGDLSTDYEVYRPYDDDIWPLNFDDWLSQWRYSLGENY